MALSIDVIRGILSAFDDRFVEIGEAIPSLVLSFFREHSDSIERIAPRFDPRGPELGAFVRSVADSACP